MLPAIDSVLRDARDLGHFLVFHGTVFLCFTGQFTCVSRDSLLRSDSEKFSAALTTGPILH